MFCGCPIVASKSGGVPEILADAGIIVKQNDAGELADAIMMVLTDAALAAAYGQKVRKRAEEYFSVNNIQQLIKIYEKFL